MIKRYLCKNNDLRYYNFLSFLSLCIFGFGASMLGAFWFSKSWVYLLWSFFDFALSLIFGFLADKQFEKVYKLKEKEKECEKK